MMLYEYVLGLSQGLGFLVRVANGYEGKVIAVCVSQRQSLLLQVEYIDFQRNIRTDWFSVEQVKVIDEYTKQTFDNVVSFRGKKTDYNNKQGVIIYAYK